MLYSPREIELESYNYNNYWIKWKLLKSAECNVGTTV